MSFDPKNITQEQMFAMFQQMMALMAANGGQMPTMPTTQPTAPAPKEAQIPITNYWGPSFEPCPEINQITLLQATFFDNWPNGVKIKNTNRYKMCLEIWTDEAEDIRLSKWASKCSVSLMDYWAFSVKFDNLLKRGTINAEYHANLKAVWAGSTKDQWFGLLGNKGDPSLPKGVGPKGTTFYDQQFIRITFDKAMKPVDFDLIVNGDFLTFSGGFENTDMKGNMLKGQAQYQARLDRCNYNDDWATATEVQ